VSCAAQASATVGEIVDAVLASQVPAVPPVVPAAAVMTSRRGRTPPGAVAGVVYVPATTLLVISVFPLSPARYRTVNPGAAPGACTVMESLTVASFWMENTKVVLVPALIEAARVWFAPVDP